MKDYSPHIYRYSNSYDNKYFIMREDLLPFSFGGNKVRKNLKYFEEIINHNHDHVVSYGSKSSNHARITANLAASYNLKSTIITPGVKGEESYNTIINNILNANIIYTPLENVKSTIESTLVKLRELGENPFFIQGGGHGIPGTKAYVDAFQYIHDYSKKHELKFDYIFLASGTGATQAGLILGNHLGKYLSTIVGISVARDSLRGESVIRKSVEEYFEYEKLSIQDLEIIFNDEYLSGGYGQYNEKIVKYINDYMNLYGIPLDTTYTGKAIYGMHDYIDKNNIEGKNILFIHTGGTPLYFDYLKENCYE